MEWPFVHFERVRFGDLDAMRHLNNVVFLRYFETARIAYLRELVPGHDPAHPEAGGFGLIFAACEIAYRSPATFDEEVAVRCRAESPGKSSFRVAFQMTVEERLIAEGHGVLVGYDYDQRRSRPLPDALRAAVKS
ncbi:MAG: thioesterase family protein [Thermoleophilaceae bacterium]